jgi:hypothetical protein
MRTLRLALLPLLLVACSDRQPDAPDLGVVPEFKAGQVGTLDAVEETHLIFMREEEKLARDVYITLGKLYRDLKVFTRIDDAEQKHTDTMAGMLDLYGIEDPSTSDKVGVFTGEDYGWYFTEKFELLLARGEIDGLEALYVGAFIEELDMHDIAHCPSVIVETYFGLDPEGEGVEDLCGLVYTDEATIIRAYESLIDGSKSHLRAYVKAIEQIIGEGNYIAQYLPQDVVDDILGR